MEASQNTLAVPEHLAVIMDGNRRWAKLRNLPLEQGWREGEERLYELVQNAVQHEIPVLTVFAFSSENWRRPGNEVRLLMKQMTGAVKRRQQQLLERGVQVCFIGSKERMPAVERRALERLEAATSVATQPRLKLTIAFDYGGQWDLVTAVQRTVEDVCAGRLQASQVNQQELEKHICLAECPPVDLLIRTGGEQRLSNFLLWQIAYAEMYFTACLWPDFSARELGCALDFFRQRQRRFGGDG